MVSDSSKPEMDSGATLARPYLKSHPTIVPSKYEVDVNKLLSTPISVPLGAMLGQLPSSWWTAQVQEAGTAT